MERGKIFIALAAIIGGLVCLSAFIVLVVVGGVTGWAVKYFVLPGGGILLIATGAGYLWMKSPFYKR